jgi:SpoVK/Ycf46/Vps4 family AAA+-type ATPase
MIDRIFVHMESKGMYKVVEVSEDPYTGKQNVKYERLGDGYSAQLPMSSFHQKLRPAEQDELEALNAVLPRLQAMGKGAFVDKVMQISTNPEQLDEQQGQSQVGILVTPTEEHDFSRIIVHDDVKKSIEMGLTKITKGELLTNLFGMKSSQGRCIMNFYGAPGTGKTMSALALAKQLNKKLYQVDYSQIISKWVGDTGKHIKAAFMEAQRLDAILFFDEADSLLSKRISMSDDAVSNSVNQNRNILMQELDRFNGIVLMATNFFQNYDEAILRRIAQHVKFELPTQEMRVKILEAHFPVMDRVTADFTVVSKNIQGFSGGDIKTLVENSALNAVVSMGEDAKITTETMLQEAQKIMLGKQTHKAGGTLKKPLGLASGTNMRD